MVIPNLASLYSLIKSKIFRPLPSGMLQAELEFQDLGIQFEAEQDQNWPILKQIYELFLELVSHNLVEVRELK